MEQEKQQGMEPPAPAPPPAAAIEPRAPPQPPPPQLQQPKTAASVQPAMPVTRPWPVAFTPMKPVVETKNVTPMKRKKHCNCKNSQCLKLYCECFAAGVYCDGCNCKNCGNTAENEKIRQAAINNTKQRNPNAFQPKIENVSNNVNVRKDDAGAAPSLPKHNKGCHCKKSNCLKKYCECFQANILCSKNCRCMDCKNFEGSEELQAAVCQGDNSCDRNIVQQAANVALNGAIGSSGYRFSPVRKKRPPEGPSAQRINGEESMIQARFQEANYADASHDATSTGRGCIGNLQNKSRLIYRSPLANTIHLSDVNDLANHLVIVWRKAAEGFTTIADNKMEKEVDREICTNDIVNFGANKEEVQKAASGLGNVTTADQQNTDESGSHFSNSQEDCRPASPGTQALMCDEQDLTFGTDYRSPMPPALPDEDISELHTALENAVMREFRNCLRRIVTRGQVNEEILSSGAVMELDAQRHPESSTILPPGKAEEKLNAPVGPENPETN
ncbi:hypothetical protein EJB05_42432 [Eragrostis curvula]|uniref:CRC domain-containing protein n=1 Tax=Eragrostis curvula TaxID=38414 RepID=A0A5J9TDE6_9POAL|nr:hypothetical protein EJB05_55073 [Eragrostis curvula]TVU08998.1 hypothetical protein EJB05_42432 [Eragrostis curvula]